MLDVFEIDWPAGNNVHAVTTTRNGGNSSGVYRSFNLGDHVNDDQDTVDRNRRLLKNSLSLPACPKWLNQVHGVNVVNANNLSKVITADGSYTTTTACVCAVLTADCLPVFISDQKGSVVGVFHAGWRGLANGILKNAVEALQVHSNELIAALGPAISQNAFEVGIEVKQYFDSRYCGVSGFFVQGEKPDHFFADLYGLAQAQLYQYGVKSVWLPGEVCTYKDSDRFYSYRRDGQTGRMASLIWIT